MSTKSPALRVAGSANAVRSEKSDGRGLTSEQIARHLAAFERNGGTVEVLGVTHTLRHVRNAAVPAAPVEAAAPAKAKKKK